MTMLYAELAGHRVLSATVTIPRRGVWTADVMLTDAPPEGISGKVELTLATLTLVGTVVRGSAFQGSYKARMVGGAGGWRTVIGPKPYRSAAGLKRGPILKDAAREAGEEIDVTDDAVIGEYFPRASGPARRVLDLLYPNWWVGTDGRAKIVARATATIATPFDLVSYDAAIGRYTVATERPDSFAPGVRFVAPTIAQAQANLVVHELAQGKLRTVIYGG